MIFYENFEIKPSFAFYTKIITRKSMLDGINDAVQLVFFGADQFNWNEWILRHTFDSGLRLQSTLVHTSFFSSPTYITN